MIDIAQYSDPVRVLALSRYGGATPRMFEVLLRHFQSLEEILLAEQEDISAIEAISDEAAARLVSASERLDDAQTAVKALTQRDIGLFTRFDEHYPKLLYELNDPPPLLYVRGVLPKNDNRSVLLTGCVEATAEGITMTSRLARELVQAGVQIISSLVGGIDAAAHLAGANAGGGSYAVADCGLDKLPQKEGVPLAIDIVTNGGVISEFEPDTEASPETMAETNRLMAGMAQAIIITEAYADSERTLDLLRCCNDIGKMVFFMIDPDEGAHADEAALAVALEAGAIMLEGYDRLEDIIKSLV